MRPLLALACVFALTATAAAQAARPDEVDTLPETSRWLSFVRLVDSRWRVRTTVMETDPATLTREFEWCVEDAWQLALGSMLEAKGPCEKLATAARPKRTKAARKAARAAPSPGIDYAKRFSEALVSPSYAEYRACTSEALSTANTSRLSACALALKARAAVVVSLDDNHRFRAWMDACKRVIVGPTPPAAAPGEKAAPIASALTNADILHARHCIRTLPTLYEIQGLKKLSDYWTPEEQRALNARSHQLLEGGID